ncbi:hypothetical protein KIH31_02820 [Paenarthrobacter sp. DKR-5]|uniref:DUF6766 family protein n=1 Tax=Paenarthrobacter sp. DKR-5 TaxID=2835535 RepID=UPI001BDD7553|nr:DUF6766 family protein [Paenarthrobacter sp. DKR-5]MBT1001525.1 hypothetical protein [Paenarthrobacter sp. DKR-5]
MGTYVVLTAGRRRLQRRAGSAWPAARDGLAVPLVALLVLGSVYLRQRGSAKSKPVTASNRETGA